MWKEESLCTVRFQRCRRTGQGRVSDDRRIRGALPTIGYLIDHGAKSYPGLHIWGRPKGSPDPKYSLQIVADRLSELLERRFFLSASRK